VRPDPQQRPVNIEVRIVMIRHRWRLPESPIPERRAAIALPARKDTVRRAGIHDMRQQISTSGGSVR